MIEFVPPSPVTAGMLVAQVPAARLVRQFRLILYAAGGGPAQIGDRLHGNLDYIGGAGAATGSAARTERDVINVNRGRLAWIRRACKVEKDGRRRRSDGSRNRIADHGIHVVPGSITLITRVASGIPQNSPLCVTSRAARQGICVKGEWIGCSPRHRHSGLVKLNHRTGTGAGHIDLKIRRAAVWIIVRANRIHRAADSRIHCPAGGGISAPDFKSSVRGDGGRCRDIRNEFQSLIQACADRDRIIERVR